MLLLYVSDSLSTIFGDNVIYYFSLEKAYFIIIEYDEIIKNIIIKYIKANAL